MATAAPHQTSPPAPSSPEQPEETEEEVHGLDNEEEEEDDEEEEPQLKYERVTGDVAKVVRSDLVSAFAVGSKYIVDSKLRRPDVGNWIA
jgi:vacuolar protein sorting-associated protein 41